MAAHSMIERVARAIRDCDPSAGATYEQAARAAIEAMREPTEAMLEAAFGNDPTLWSRMIDASLEEPK